MTANDDLTPRPPLRSGEGGKRLVWTVFAFLLTLAAFAHAETYALDFSQPDALQAVTLDGRQSARTEEGHVLLRGGSSVYVTQRTGPGTYHVRFTMIEAEKFQYHVPMLELFKQDAQDPGSDGYAILWQPWGLITLQATVDDDRIHRREFIDPGRDNPNRYESGDVVDLTLHVPPEGDCVEVYTFATEPKGEPTCRFKLLDLPLEGHFGWRNTKWYSHVRIEQFDCRPDR